MPKGMEPSKEQIKTWMKRFSRSREWLAAQCGKSKNTVNNWLSTNIEIPTDVLRLISHLIDADEAAETERKNQEGADPLQNLLVEVDVEEFKAWSRAALGKHQIVHEWALDAIRRAYEEDVANSSTLSVAPSGGDSEANIVEHDFEASSKLWIDLHGGVAAGSPIGSDVTPTAIPAGKPYPDDHFALKVFGRSMEPKIKDGSIIIVKKWGPDKGFPKKGTLVIYTDGMGATLKEFGYRKAGPDEEADNMGNVPVLRSLNKAFPDVQTMDGGQISAIFVDVL